MQHQTRKLYTLRVPGTPAMPSRFATFALAREAAVKLVRLQGWTVDILDAYGRRIDTVAEPPIEELVGPDARTFDDTDAAEGRITSLSALMNRQLG